ncbi:hypothetical protein, partial [Fundidesulfovibrio magnetotacticus]|uniref:hypothetical protein n=1 Tax=Fundidesulfovibrio magnetotacticus TaxID=2730080 RepID=UPI001566C242
MWTEERIRENQAKYERMLDAAFGPDSGKEAAAEMPQAVQQPVREPSYPSYEDVYAALACDKEALELFQDGWEDTFTPYDLGPPPGDTAGQLRWYILRDLNEHHHKRHRLDFEDARKHRTRQRVEQLFRKLAALD